MDEQKMVNSQLLRMSEEEHIPLVATNDIHYTYDTDPEAHDILLCIQTGKKLDDENRMRYEGGQYYLKSPEEMRTLFSYAPEAIAMCLEAAKVVPQIRYVGWDVAITKDGPEFIEGNMYCAHDFWQLPPHTPDGIGMLPTIMKYAKDFRR